MGHDVLSGVAVDGAGAVVVAGAFRSSTATFGGVELTSAGSYAAVLWKLNADGTTPWAVRGTGRYYSPRHRMPFKSSNAGSKRDG